jgi:hypothetical protein
MSVRAAIIPKMARGWESKSVEEQQSQAQSPAKHGPALTPEQQARQRGIEGLTLSRNRVLQQLATVQNPRHRSLLQAELAALDAQLAQMG